MKRFLSAVIFLLSVSVHAQFVKPNTFPLLSSVDSTNFEVYSQKNGLTRRANIYTIKTFTDQSLVISGDSVCITKNTGTTCVKLPAQAFNQKSQSWSTSVVSQSYSLPSDTVAKYDYMFIQYETNSTPSGSTITLPNPSVSTIGKVIDVFIYLGPSATISTPTINGTIGVVTGSTYYQTNSYFAVAGHYRFVGVDGLQTSGYKWQMISSPESQSVSAFSSKRVKSQVVNSQVVIFSSSTFQNTDEFTIYAEAETNNTQVRVPVPDSSFAGKVIYYYPQKTGSYNNVIACNEARILEISQTTPFATTTTSLATVNVPKKLTGVLYEGVYYWEMRDVNNGSSSAVTGITSTFITVVNASDTVKIDTINKYDEIHYTLVSNGNRTIYLPSTIPAKGKVFYFYPYRSSATPTTPVITLAIAGGSNLIRYINPDGSTDAVSSIQTFAPVKLVSNGIEWYWLYSADERMAQNKLLGRFSSGTGPAQEISISSDFTMTGGTLALVSSGSGYNFYTTTFAGGGRIIVAYQGSVPSASSPSAGNYTLNIPANCRPISFTFNGGTADLTVGGALNITCAWTSLPSSINTNTSTAFLPAITIISANSPNVQLNNQGPGYQITHPVISAGSTTTSITGINGIANYIVKGIF